MKKWIALCGAVLALGLLTACSQTGRDASLPRLDPQNPVSLEIWHYYNGPQKTAFDTMVTEFNETVGLEQGIVVEAFSQGSVNELAAKIADSAAQKVGSEELPNIFAAYADTAFLVDGLGLLADLDPYLTDEAWSGYRAEFIEEGRIRADGGLKIFPVAKSVELLMLNRTDWDKFSSATGAQLSDLETLEGITATARAYYAWTDSLTDAPDDGKAFFGRDAMANYCIIGSRQLGAEVFGDGTLVPDKDVFRRLWDNYYVPYINGWFTASGRFRSDSARMGDIVALVGSSSGSIYFPSAVSVSDSESYRITCTVLPAPIFAGGKRYAVQQGAGMCVIKSDSATEYAASLFLKWFTEPERNVAFAVSSGYLPVQNAALDPDLIDAALDQSALEPGVAVRMKEAFAAALEQISVSTLYTTQAFEGGNACRAVLETSMSQQAETDRQAIDALVAGGLSRAEAVAGYDTDEHFDAWFSQFCIELEAARSAS